jgi:LysM repeat protein
MFSRLAIVLLAVSLLVAIVARPSGSAGRPAVYVVKPTDTLWSIAARHYSGDPREGVWELQRRNGLSGTMLVPGERLVLP